MQMKLLYFLKNTDCKPVLNECIQCDIAPIESHLQSGAKDQVCNQQIRDCFLKHCTCTQPSQGIRYSSKSVKRIVMKPCGNNAIKQN